MLVSVSVAFSSWLFVGCCVYKFGFDRAAARRLRLTIRSEVKARSIKTRLVFEPWEGGGGEQAAQQSTTPRDEMAQHFSLVWSRHRRAPYGTRCKAQYLLFPFFGPQPSSLLPSATRRDETSSSARIAASLSLLLRLATDSLGAGRHVHAALPRCTYKFAPLSPHAVSLSTLSPARPPARPSLRCT